jgi:hypothetical protein
MRRLRTGAALVAALLAGGVVVAAPARADDPSFLTLGAGAFDFLESDSRAAQVELQYRSDLKLWVFQPMVGVSATADSTAYVYAGISLDLFFGSRLVVRPSFAPGLYRQGDGKDLGHTVEFRSSLEVAYRFDDRSRLGLELYHRSNAGLGDRNPGEESLMLTYSIPLSKPSDR